MERLIHTKDHHFCKRKKRRALWSFRLFGIT